MRRAVPAEEVVGMQVFVVGVTGRTGLLLARDLVSRGDVVRGLVRDDRGRRAAEEAGVVVTRGDIADLDVGALAGMLAGADVVVYAAGSNGGAREVTDAVDGEGVCTALAAAVATGVPRFLLLSVLPEAWRERELPPDEEHYFHVKKRADVDVTRSSLDWVVLRPSLLTDGSATDAVTLGPAVVHGEVGRADVAATIAEIVHEPGISRQVLELDGGRTPVRDAVRQNVVGSTR
ncbi:NAD(P)H-binding protein [Phycicoccus avicenniae]|uniref:NAD(P)H-binding protein n=1 Tax=Phycicoccus avicenniae TaxID=2828860 RepID=UPI003D2AC89D